MQSSHKEVMFKPTPSSQRLITLALQGGVESDGV